MRTVIFCEGTTDLVLIQCVLQYRYGWKYKGFLENAETNKLLKRTLVKAESTIEIRRCVGIMNIPYELKELQDQIAFSKTEELIDKVIVVIDHDTISSNREFIDKVNSSLGTCFSEDVVNTEITWKINNAFIGEINLSLLIHCIPEYEIGAIENVMLEALAIDDIEKMIIERSNCFITDVSHQQNRYLQKKSLIVKAIFNTYFAIRTPEETPTERSRILRAYDWKHNEVLNKCFAFLNIG